MTWEEYTKISPYVFERPPTWDAEAKHYVLDYHLSTPVYSQGFTWEQENKLYHYHNDVKDASGGGLFSYDTLEEAQQELGICYLQSTEMALEDKVEMRVAGSHHTYQVVAKYALRDASKGRSISVQAILYQGRHGDFILSTQPKQPPEMADHYVENLDTDVTLVKLSDTVVLYLCLADTISYHGSIAFDTPPDDLFGAALDVLETLHN